MKNFIGGWNLQGSCHNFRGKLCLWAHLLKISASDSVEDIEYVKSLMAKKAEHVESPSQVAAAAAREKIPASPSRSVNHSKTPKDNIKMDHSKTPTDKINMGRSKTPTDSVKIDRSRTPTDNVNMGRSKTPTDNVKMDRSKTPTDSGKKKQGAWKEARGPQGGKGFDGLRNTIGGKSGYKAWKHYVRENATQTVCRKPPQSTVSTAKCLDDAIAGLKTVLGVASASSASGLKQKTLVKRHVLHRPLHWMLSKR